MKEQIQMFESKKVRTVWDEEQEKWYFSIVDVVSVLTDSADPTDYLKKMRKREPELGIYIGTNCPQVQMTTHTGKMRKTLAADVEQIFRIIQSIPSPKAEPFKQWLAQVAAKNGGVARNNGIGVKTDDLFEKISTLIEESRKKVATAVNVAEVYTKYEIGRYIVEDEQEGKYKAAYGKRVLAQLASQLQSKFGQGWGEDVLGNCRKFYIVYSQPQISDTVCRKSLLAQESEDFRYTVSEFQNAPAVPHKFVLSWSHYLVLMRVDNADARSFYEIEAAKENWSVRWLQRQVGSSLYERIALSKDYVLIDLKIDKLTHQDLGQMQMYVNYYDRYVRQEFEKPTVGILLCRKKNDALVELTLSKDANIYAAQYELYLPDKKELQEKLRSWVEEFKNEMEGGDED